MDCKTGQAPPLQICRCVRLSQLLTVVTLIFPPEWLYAALRANTLTLAECLASSSPYNHSNNSDTTTKICTCECTFFTSFPASDLIFPNGWQEKQIILKEKLQKKLTNANLLMFVHFRHTKKSHAGACKVSATPLCVSEEKTFVLGTLPSDPGLWCVTTNAPTALIRNTHHSHTSLFH